MDTFKLIVDCENQNLDTNHVSLFFSLSYEAHGAWEVGKNLRQKRFENCSQCQNPMDFNDCISKTCFGWV